jgi:ATP-binding cassette subfamily F protein 3
VDRREQRRREAEARNQLAPLRAELRRVERELESWSSRRGALELELGDPEFYSRSDAAHQRKTLEAHAAAVRTIESLETRWLELGEQLEAGA